MIAYATEEDFTRWHKEHRQDIIEAIDKRRVIWAGDRMVSTETGLFSHVCPFLTTMNGKCFCTIYETRPQVCRDFVPGTSVFCPQWQKEKKGVHEQ